MFMTCLQHPEAILHTVTIISSLILSIFFQCDVKLTIYVHSSVSGFEIDDITTVTDTVLEIQHLGNISLGKLFLTNLMTLWYQWSVSKLGQLPKLVGQLTSSILHRPQQRCAGFITLVSHEHALTPPSKAQLFLIAWKIIICAGKSKAQILS